MRGNLAKIRKTSDDVVFGVAGDDVTLIRDQMQQRIVFRGDPVEACADGEHQIGTRECVEEALHGRVNFEHVLQLSRRVIRMSTS